MADIRVLIVDDAIVVRLQLKKMLNQAPGIEVAGTAANGRVALDMIPQAKPDVVILDVEMPVMSGLETLAEIRKRERYLPVIMFSAHTVRGAVTTLEALGMGADDYATKPTSSDPETIGVQVNDALIPKIRIFAYRSHRKTAPKKRPNLARSRIGQRVDVLTIAASTGGPNALTALLNSMDMDLPVPVLVVQHMPPVFTRLFAERLNTNTRHNVRECVHGAALEPGHVWLAPGGYHMEVAHEEEGYRLRTHQRKKENQCRPAADPLFRSVARVYGAHALAVVLTGMGHDGLDGCKHVQAGGGQVIVQDEASSVIWSMPGSVAEAGLAEAVLPLSGLGAEIKRRLACRRKGA